MLDQVNVISKTPCSGGYTHLRLVAKNIAIKAEPGQWVLWGNRALYIMRSDGKAGWIELLFSGETPSESMIEGPVGQALVIPERPSRLLLTATTKQLPSLIFFADRLRQSTHPIALLLLQADQELPFRPTPCRTMISGMPAGIIATLPLLSEWGIAVRIASHSGLPGCFDGDVDTLAEQWLSKQPLADEIKYFRLDKDLTKI